MLKGEQEDTYHVVLAKRPNVHGGLKFIFIFAVTPLPLKKKSI